MAHTYMTLYTIITVILATIDFFFAYRAFGKTEKIGKALGWSAFFAGVITLSYLLSVNTSDARLVSISSSLTFIGIDCMLVSLLYFVFLATGYYRGTDARFAMNTMRLLALLDSIVLLLNIFTGFAVSYAPQEPVGIVYGMKPLYVIHLIFTYFIVAAVLALLIYKCFLTPGQYRNQYLLLIASIGVVVAINAVFLFQQEGSFFAKVDCSILGYSFGLFLMYWTAFDYRTNDMLKSLSQTVLENINQGVVLFDYEDALIIHNRRAEELLKGVRFESDMRCEAFLEACGISLTGEDRYSGQCDIEEGVPLRCDYRRVRGKRERVIGNLFVFTDLSRDADLSTGFEYARDGEYLKENGNLFRNPTAVAVFDLLGLKEINRVLGRDEGDRRIRALAKTMRRHMPAGTRFLRGYEAYLIALCPGMMEADIRECAEQVVKDSAGPVMYGLSATNDGPANDFRSGAVRTAAEALEIAYRSIQIKKLLTPGSTRSQTLSSLVRALEAADSDTEAHVRRTQKTGALLGRRIGLCDAELTSLELLCLLHDIGKIGIPLEILNKPGRLTDREWAVLRTHAEKGYQITLSSDELKSIADLVLSHHERWDGKGYPRMLAGPRIPVLSRIISVVDAYDAMVNDRSYRKAMSPEAAQQEIRQNAGTQFDPRLAEEFLKLLEENADLALGEKVSGEVEMPFEMPSQDVKSTGVAAPIAYSRYLLDSEGMMILETDARFETITGYTREEAVGKLRQIDLIPMEDRTHYLIQVGNQLSQGDIAYIRHEILRKDGERVPVVCCGRRYFDSAAKEYRSEIIVFQG